MKKTKPAVVPDLGLHRLVEQWDQSLLIANRSWMIIARYVRDNNVSRPALFYALVKIHGMKESSAQVECSRLLRFQKSRIASNALDRALNGEAIPLSALKYASIEQRRPAARKSAQKQLAERASGAESALEERTDKELAKLARDAVKGGTRDAKTFLAQAKVAFDLAVCRDAQDAIAR